MPDHLHRDQLVALTAHQLDGEPRAVRHGPAFVALFIVSWLLLSAPSAYGAWAGVSGGVVPAAGHGVGVGGAAPFMVGQRPTAEI